MTARILLRDGISHQATSIGVGHEINGVDLDASVSVLRAKAAPFVQLTVEEIGSCID